MIRVPVIQRTPEWVAARIGIPTSSQFDRILTPKTMKLSSQADAYLCELLAERMMRASLDDFSSDWTERGSDLEADAVAFYELQRDVEVEIVGLILDDTGRVGCSPDALVGEDGGLEIKCPSPGVHVANLLGMADKHRGQIQGAMWITGRKWWDLLSYHPLMPPALVRVERDEEYIGKLAEAMEALLRDLEAATVRLGIEWATAEAVPAAPGTTE